MKVTFVHGRPGPHKLHMEYGRRVANDIRFVDPLLRWHDKNTFSLWRYACWFVNALSFVSWRKSVILTEGLHITLVISKILSFGRVKLICLADDESPYFVVSRYYKGLSYKANRLAFRSHDGIICIGQMVTGLIREITQGTRIRLATGINGIEDSRLQRLKNVKPDLSSMNLICIANGPRAWRSWYKGMDLMILSFAELAEQIPQLRLVVVGVWDSDEIGRLKSNLNHDTSKRVVFAGYTEDIERLLSQTSLCLHIGRGEAWGIGPTEAMAAGVPAIVSEWTGAREVVQQADPRLIVPLRKEPIIECMKWYFSMPEATRSALSERSREAATNYSSSRAVDMFERNFLDLMSRL